MKKILSLLKLSGENGILAKVADKIPGKLTKNWPLNVREYAGFAIILLVILVAFGLLEFEVAEQLIDVLEQLSRGSE